MMTEQNVQRGPFPAELAAMVAELEYRPGWRVDLRDIVRDPGDTHAAEASGLTLIITTKGYDSYHPERGEDYRVNHYFPVPAATYSRASWMRWLFEQYLLVERHECMEFFTLAGDKPFAPNHGPGEDPYIVHDLTDETARATSFRGVVQAQ